MRGSGLLQADSAPLSPDFRPTCLQPGRSHFHTMPACPELHHPELDLTAGSGWPREEVLLRDSDFCFSSSCRLLWPVERRKGELVGRTEESCCCCSRCELHREPVWAGPAGVSCLVPCKPTRSSRMTCTQCRWTTGLFHWIFILFWSGDVKVLKPFSSLPVVSSWL